VRPKISAGVRARLSLLVALAVVPGGAVLFHAAAAQHRALFQDVQGDLLRIALLASEKMRGALEHAHGALDAFASLPSVRASASAECSAAARSILEREPQFVNIAVAEPDGHVFCNALPVQVAPSLAAVQYFQDALRSRDWVVGDFHIGRSTGRPVLPVSRVLIGEGGTKLGVAYVLLDLAHLDELLAKVEGRPGVVLTVVDNHGTILGRHPGTDRPPGSLGEVPLVKQMLLRGATTGEAAGSDGIEQLYAVTEVRAGDSPTGIRIFAEIPRSVALAEVNRRTVRDLLAYLALGVFGLAIAWVGAEIGVVRKLRRMAKAARQLQSGDLSARSGVKAGQDEVSLLACAFDDMAHSIEALTKQNRLILDSAGVGIYGVDREGLITFVNPAAAEMLGCQPAELLGQASDPLILASLKDGEEHHFEDAILRRKDGKPIPADVITTPIREDGLVIGAVIALRDLIERKQLEAQLEHAQKMEAVGRLAAGISHDFNNLLTVILGAGAELSGAIPAGTPLQEAAQEVVTAATRAANLTRQLLMFSRKQVVEPVVLSPNVLVEAMRPMLERLVGREIEVVTKLAAKGSVRGDPGQLEQVILNLAANSRDAMPRGGRITLESKDVELDGERSRGWMGAVPGPYVLVAVSDDGTGMDEATLRRIFEPFFTTKGPGKGTGLGLSTVWGIVKQSGGDIQVRSTPGEGSTFEIYLPLVDTTSEQRTSEANGARAHPAKPLSPAHEEGRSLKAI